MLLAACSDNDYNEIDPVVPNSAPVLVSVADQQISANESADPIVIDVSDDSMLPSDLQIVISSSDQSLIRDEDLILSDFSGSQAELIITPVMGQTGSVVISVSAIDSAGASAQISFNLDVVSQQLSADSIIRSIFANDKDSAPVSLDAIELIQDVDNENQYDDLIDSSN